MRGSEFDQCGDVRTAKFCSEDDDDVLFSFQCVAKCNKLGLVASRIGTGIISTKVVKKLGVSIRFKCGVGCGLTFQLDLFVCGCIKASTMQSDVVAKGNGKQWMFFC